MHENRQRAYSHAGPATGTATMSVSKNSMNCSFRRRCVERFNGRAEHDEENRKTNPSTSKAAVLLEDAGEAPVLQLAQAPYHGACTTKAGTNGFVSWVHKMNELNQGIKATPVWWRPWLQQTRIGRQETSRICWSALTTTSSLTDEATFVRGVACWRCLKLMLLSAMKSMLWKINITFNDGGKQSIWESDATIMK